MNFKQWLEAHVLAHISGASGSGKTSIANELAVKFPHVIFKDLDELDDEATAILHYNIRKNDYTDAMLANLANLRQKLMDDFVKNSDKPVVFVGHHTEGEHVLNIPTKNKFALNVDAKTSAWRAYLRSQKENPEHRRTLEDLPVFGAESPYIVDAGRQSDRAERGRLPTSPLG